MVLAAVKIAFLAAWTWTAAPGPQATAPVAVTGRALPAREATLTAELSLAEPVTQAEAGVNATPPASVTPVGNDGVSDMPASSSGEKARAAVHASAQQDDPLQAALIQASAHSALSVAHVLGASVAQAADLPPVPDVAAPAPRVRPMASPVAPERVIRPDEVTPQAPPAPKVGPYVSPDSATRKQAEINRREQELLGLQQQMETRMSELHGLENRLQGMLQDADDAQASKFKQLVDMYANMKPRVAAQALTNMDETIAVKILTGMKSKESGEVLSYMDPVHAARLSEVMSKMQM
ncbi:MAG: hypothetical protein J1E80_02685 [Desulfovibrionaceae bacterium]|nr:hypothetical protein [Desulfovibrionaceae bacterium]